MPLYDEMMGGSAKIIAKGRELIGQGRYLHAAEILDKLVFTEPGNMPARQLLADAYEQLGYQAESTSVRNTFLQGAFVLRNGLPGGLPSRTTGPDVHQLRDRMVPFTPDFEILPGTSPTERLVPPGRSLALPAHGLIQSG